MISAVVLTKNSEQTLEQCLASLAWCDEILVIDDNSLDKTIQIAKTYNARVLSHPLDNNFARQRNFALENTTGEWVLFVDSDEVVTKALEAEIQHAVKNGQHNGYLIRRQDILFGKQLRFGETAQVKLLRLGRKGKGIWKRSVHEVWEIEGPIGKCTHPLLHYPHQSLREFIEDINRYSTLHAQELYREGKRASAFEIVAFPLGKFIQNYIIRQGFRDQTPGAILAFMMSFHSFLARAKLYLMKHKP
jgi:glycosyltransferase involved in cell wall biosynthesis